jgi:hypothetical protein
MLKPCPFCGSAAKAEYSERGNEWWIECTSNDCPVVARVGMRDYDMACDTWNHRHEPQRSE